MLSKYRKVILACSITLIMALPASQGHAQTAAQKKAVKIQGEPISPAAPPISPPANTNKTDSAVQPNDSSTAAVAGAKKAAKETHEVDFEDLASFEFETPNSIATNLSLGITEANKQIPPAIMKFDGKEVSITGFPLTLAVEKGKVTELLVMKNQAMCCFGTTPKITEWVTVKLAGDGVETVPMDQLVTVKGTLHIGARTESHTIVDLYRMDAAKMVDY